MPRRRSEVATPSRSLVASSANYTGNKRAFDSYRPGETWQKECYRHYHICGEARYAAKFFGHAVSRAYLYVEDKTGKRLDSGPSFDSLEAMFSGRDGQRAILDALGLHLTIAGECYLVGREIDGSDSWEVVSVLEMRVVGDKWSIDYGNSKKVDLSDTDAIVRVWLRDPASGEVADSPFRTMLPILKEIEWLTRHVFAQVQSRLAGAGLLFIPDGVTFPPAPGQDGKAAPVNDADAFMTMLGDAMLAPIQDPGSPAALIPGVVMVPGEQIANIQLMHFWSDLDSEAKDLRNEAIRRFATGMDLPVEEILGMSSNGGTGGGTSNGVSHWGAWQVEESTIKMHVEPMLDVIVRALTIDYLRTVTETEDFVAYSTEKLRLRPDRSKEAFELWDRGVLATRVLLTENGFNPESDLPTPEEFRVWLLVKVASGSATPEQVQAALGALGVDLPVLELESGTPREARPEPSLDDHPTRPRTPGESALLVACDALVFRALERVGNRIRAKGVSPRGLRAYEVHTAVSVNGSAKALMEDAWSCADQILDGVGDPQKYVPILNAYCERLLTEGKHHKREDLALCLGI